MTARRPLLTDDLLDAMVARRSGRDTAPDLRTSLAATVVQHPQRAGWGMVPSISAWRSHRRAFFLGAAAALLALGAILALAAGQQHRSVVEATRLIAYTRNTALYLLDVDTRLETKLADSYAAALVGWASDGTHLLLGDGRVVAMDGSIRSPFGQRDTGGLLSPDGQALATWNETADPVTLVVTTVDGSSRPLPLPAVPHAENGAPAGWMTSSIVWSPDSTRLAVTANVSCTGDCSDNGSNALGFEVYVVPVDGGPVSRVAQVPEAGPNGFYPQAVWSPDGSTLAIATNVACMTDSECGAVRGHVQVVRLDGSVTAGFDVAPVAPGTPGFPCCGIPALCCGIAWSPAGDRLAIASLGPVLVVGRDGAAPLTVGRGPNIVSSQAWSPDGTSIAYGVSDDLSAIASADGGDPVLLPFGSDLLHWSGGFAGPAWQPAPGTGATAP